MDAEDLVGKLPGGQMPPCSKMLGWRYEDSDAERGWLRASYEGREEFLNPAGKVQGGILTAMLDDTMGPAVLLASKGTVYAPTININVSFLAPADPGRLYAEATVTQLGRSVCFVEGRIMDAEGRVLATATCSARITPVQRLDG